MSTLKRKSQRNLHPNKAPSTELQPLPSASATAGARQKANSNSDRHWAVDGIVAVVVTHGYVSKEAPGSLLEDELLDITSRGKVTLKATAKGKVSLKHYVQYLVKFTGYGIDQNQLLDIEDFHNPQLAYHAFAHLDPNENFVYDKANKAYFLPVSAEHFAVQVLEGVVGTHDLDAYLDRVDYPADDIRSALEHRTDFTLLGENKKSPYQVLQAAKWFKTGNAPTLQQCSLECLRDDHELKTLFDEVDIINSIDVKVDSSVMLQRVLNPFFDDLVFSKNDTHGSTVTENVIGKAEQVAIRHWFGQNKAFYEGVVPRDQDLPSDEYDDALRDSANDPEDAPEDSSGAKAWPAALRRISHCPWSQVTKGNAKKQFEQQPDGVVIFERAQRRYHMPKSVSEVYKHCLISGLKANCMTECGHPFVRVILQAWWHFKAQRGDRVILCPGCFAEMSFQPFPVRILARQRSRLFVQRDPTATPTRRFNPAKYHEVNGIYYFKTRRGCRGGKKVRGKGVHATPEDTTGHSRHSSPEDETGEDGSGNKVPANANGKRPAPNDKNPRPWKRLSAIDATQNTDYIEVQGPDDPALSMDQGPEDDLPEVQLQRLVVRQTAKREWLTQAETGVNKDKTASSSSRKSMASSSRKSSHRGARRVGPASMMGRIAPRSPSKAETSVPQASSQHGQKSAASGGPPSTGTSSSRQVSDTL